MWIIRIFIFAAVALSSIGCARNIAPDNYTANAVGQANLTVQAIIINAQPVSIGGTNSGVGMGAGAIAGGALGSQLGSNVPTQIVGAVGGAVVGGVAGAVGEDLVTRQTGIQYVVKTSNGALISVVQGASPTFAVGQKVLVIYGSRIRIIADQ